MVINKNKMDILVSINGDRASQYQHDVSLLLQGELPPDWRTHPCSMDAFVAVNTRENVFYKAFFPRNKFEKIKGVFKGSRCKRSRTQANILHKAGLPTPQIICWGKGRNIVFLITEGFDGIGLFQYLKTNFRPPLDRDKIKKKRKLLKEVGSLIGKMHARGIVHGDLRQNNLLVREVEKKFQFSFIDNERNSKWRVIPLSKILKNLVQLSIFSDNILTKTDLMRLYNSYAVFYPRFYDRDRRRFFLQKVFKLSQNRTLLIKVKKMLQENCHPYKYKYFQGKCLQGSIVAQQFASGLDPDEWFSTSKVELKNDNNISVRLLPGFQGDVVAKHFTIINILLLPRYWQKLHRAQRQWKMSHIFMAMGIPVARPLGFANKEKGLLIRSTYYFSEYLGIAKDLVRISREVENFHDWLNKNKTISRFAIYLARLHNYGYCHGDTKWANILANVNSGKFWLIDLDGACRIKSNLGRDVYKDLSRFSFDMIKYNLSKDLQDEFINVYCSARSLNKNLVQEKTKIFIRKISARHTNKMQKNRENC